MQSLTHNFTSKIKFKPFNGWLKIVSLVVLLVFGSELSAQNLVPNPSFEEYTDCPCYQNGQSQDNSISNCLFWRGTNTSSDYFNSCANIQCPTISGVPDIYGQYARTGHGMTGIGLFVSITNFQNIREYIQVALIDTLLTEASYAVSFFVQLQQNNSFAVNNIGAFLSNGSFSTAEWPLSIDTSSNSQPMVAPFEPQIVSFGNPIINDSLNNWVQIKGIYRASGNETYLTIGNFKNDSNTDTIQTSGGFGGWAYYYIDDVSVEEITQPFWQYHDTTVYYGDSVLIGPALTGLDIDWYTDNLDFISNAPGIYVTPPTSRDYIAKETFDGVETEHVVHVTVIGGAGLEEDELQNVRVFPNPSKGSFSISGITSDKPLQLEVRDVHGKLVFEEKAFSKEANGFALDVENGIYFVRVVDLESKGFVVEKLVVSR